MGNVTAKTSGEIASFMTPAETNITSLKVHFSPKQLGEGDPSPENVREIVGWDGVETHIYNSDFQITPINGVTTSFGVIWTVDNNGLIKAEGTPTSWSSCSIGYIDVRGNEIIKCFVYGSLNNVTLNKPVLYNSKNETIPLNTSDNYDGVLLKFLDLSQYEDVKRIRITLKRSTNDIYMSGSCYVVIKKQENINDIFKTTIEKSWTRNIKQWTYTDTTIDDSYPSNNFNGYDNGRWDNVIADIPNEWFGKELVYSAYIERSSSPLNNYDDVRVWCYGDSTTLFDAKTAQRIYTAEESERSWVTFTIPEGTTKIGLGLCLSKGSRAYNPQLEYGSEPTEYQPYVGTVYGGYVDLVSGELVEEYYSVIENGQKSWSFNNYNDNYYRAFITPSTLEVPNPIINSNKQFYNMCLNGTYTTKFNGWIGSTGNFLFYLPQSLGITTNDEWANFLSINPLQICYPLAEPITHQLTPTQLSSFIGQNNFWSNADYVEIEYELKETEDIQKARKKIILNQPQLKTISDKIVSFNTDMVAPIKNCKIYFKPIQLGSGDPSPTNVRDINGWTGLDSYVNGDKIGVDWTSDAGTVYGGYLDLAKNEVVATYVIFEKKWNEYPNNYAMTDVNRRSILFPYERRKIGAVRALCNIAPPAHDLQNKIHFYIAPENNYIYMFLPKDLDEETLVQVASRIEEPIHYSLSSLTSQQLLTIKSTNHIWSETNGQQIDVKYWTHKNLTPTPLTDYLENQTWTDSAYISSSGKKTINGTSALHFLTNQILLEAGTYVLSGFSHYVGTDNTNYRIHAYDSTGKWLRQITFQQIGNLSPVDISFTLDTDTYVNVSIAMDFDGVLAKIN